MVFVLLPSLGYIVVTATLERGRAHAQAQADLLSQARLAGNAEQQSLDELGRTLALTAALPPVRDAAQTSNSGPCQTSLAQIAELNPQTLGFNLWNLKGDAICADRPVTAPANVANKLWFRQVLAGRAFALGDFELSSATGQPAIAVGYPVSSSAGALVAVISSGLDLNHLIQSSSTLALPSDALVTVFDHNGLVLARSKDSAAWLGKPEAPGLAASLAQSSAASEQVGADGLRRPHAYTPGAR